MYVLFLIEIYELFSEFSGFFLMAWLGLIIYENILKCDKCATEYIEIQKSFSLWCIIVNFLRQTKARVYSFEPITFSVAFSFWNVYSFNPLFWKR